PSSPFCASGKAASPSGPHLYCRKQPAPTLIEMRAHRLPALPNRSPVDHATDLRRFAAHRNPQGPSHSAAGPQIAIQLMFGLSLAATANRSSFFFSETVPRIGIDGRKAALLTYAQLGT